MRIVQKVLRSEFGGKAGPINRHVATFAGEVTSLPGCPVIGVSHAVYRMDGEPGHGRQAFRQRAQQMRELGYAIMLCTVVEDNAAQLKILVSEGAFRVMTFTNPQTGNSVAMYCHHLIRD